jgi:uncharacterized Ntn-hydrolase superfamily protein
MNPRGAAGKTPRELSRSPVATFTIIATDPETGDIGVATASRYVAVGSLVPHVRAGVGAVATQSVAHPQLATELLDKMEDDAEPGAALEELLAADARRDSRQIGVITPAGHATCFTGSDCVAYAGSERGTNVMCLGNMLSSPSVCTAMLEGFEGTEGRLWLRLLSALDRGEAAGGDKRGKQAGALRVHRRAGGYRGSGEVVVDLRVDDHPEPVAELWRLFALLRETRESEPDSGLND